MNCISKEIHSHVGGENAGLDFAKKWITQLRQMDEGLRNFHRMPNSLLRFPQERGGMVLNFFANFAAFSSRIPR